METVRNALTELSAMQAHQIIAVATSLNLSEQTNHNILLSNQHLNLQLLSAAKLTDGIRLAREEFADYHSILSHFLQTLTVLFDARTWTAVRNTLINTAQWLVFLFVIYICGQSQPIRRSLYRGLYGKSFLDQPYTKRKLI